MPQPQPNDVPNGTLVGISDRLIRALPPAMLVIVLLNIATLGVMVWAFQHNVSARNEMLDRILTSCLPHDGSGR